MAIADGDPAILAYCADGEIMAGKVAKPADGDPVLIVAGADGKPVAVAPAGASNPCDPDPEMLCTVAGTTGTIDWCGETWELPAESGVEKSVCPTSHTKSRTYSANPPDHYNWFMHHNWINTDTASGLKLERNLWSTWSLTDSSWYGYVLPTPSAFNVVSKVEILGSIRDRKKWYGLTVKSGSYAIGFPIYPAGITSSMLEAGLGLITGATRPKYNDYAIPDAFFGSHTTGGVTYTWARGEGW